MRTRLLPIAVLLVAACRTARSGDPADILLSQQSAWNRGDVDAFVELGYWRSSELTFFSGGDIAKGYDALLARYRRRYRSPGAEMGRLTFRDVETIWSGPDIAVVRGRWALDFEAAEDASGLFTLVLRRLSDGWRIVHDHSSAAPP